MKKIVKTSRGWLDIDMATSGWHGATSFGEDGWEDEGAVWNETYGADRGQPTLASFLAATAGIPAEEADALAEQVLHEWGERQGTVAVERERGMTKIGWRAFVAV